MRPGAEGGWTEALFYGPSWVLIHFAYNAHGRYMLLECGITMFFNRASDSLWASQVMLVVKNMPANVGDERDVDFIPGSGRSPGEGNGNALQCSCLENPMDRGAWQVIVRGVTKSRT